MNFDEFVRLTIPVSYHHHIVVVAYFYLIYVSFLQAV